MAAALSVYFAAFVQHRLAPGERGMVLVLAASQAQARSVLEYIRGFFDTSAVLSKEIVASSQQEITLRNGIVIAVHSNSFRTIRGRTLCAVVLDEVAYWRDEASALPDVETYRAVLPSLATTNGMLIAISTPYRKFGLLHQKHRDHFGQDSADTLVVQGTAKMFNPTLDDAVIAAQVAADPTAAPAEWDAIFRDDIAAFLDDELIDAAIEYGRPPELPPSGGYANYSAFTDAAGGTGLDAYTLSIGHKNGEHFVIDVVRGTTGKFDPAEVTRQYAALLNEYRIGTVTGDAYAAEWVAGAWRDAGVTYARSELPKSQIYLECVPLFTRGLVRLPDHARLLRELRLLERRTHRGGKDSVDHPRGGHDDHANAVCGVLRALSNYLGYDTSYKWLDTDTDVGRRDSGAAVAFASDAEQRGLRAHPRASSVGSIAMKKPLALTDNLLHLIKHAARSLLVDAHYDRQISERRNSRRTVRPLFAGPMLAICPTALSARVCPLRLPVALRDIMRIVERSTAAIAATNVSAASLLRDVLFASREPPLGESGSALTQVARLRETKLSLHHACRRYS